RISSRGIGAARSGSWTAIPLGRGCRAELLHRLLCHSGDDLVQHLGDETMRLHTVLDGKSPDASLRIGVELWSYGRKLVTA
ncbi:MAG TPA: hypothetical protein VJX94_32240, partial [Stellaceae bacterium]|nr:hypothetical protein [Stellaceae bacterium]